MTTLKLISKLEKEHKQLSRKCDNLYKFLESDKFTELDIDMQHWMLRQNKHMTGYTGRKDRGNNKFGKEWSDLNSKGVSLREIGRMYGVAHHTVKRTIIKYAEEQEV